MARFGFGTGRRIAKFVACGRHTTTQCAQTFSCDSRYLALGFRNRDSRADTRGFASFAWTPVQPIAGVSPNSIPAQDTRGPVGSSTKIIVPHPKELVLAFYGKLDEVMIWEHREHDWLVRDRLPVSGVVADLAYACDGKALAAVTFRDASDGSVYVWYPDERRKTVLDIKQDRGSAIAFSPNGETLFAGFESGRLVWWDLERVRGPQSAPAAPCGIVDSPPASSDVGAIASIPSPSRTGRGGVSTGG